MSSRILYFGLAAFLTLLFATLLLASKVPSLGFNALADHAGVVVARIEHRGPADTRLRVNDRLIAIESATHALTLEPQDAMAWPGSINTLSQYRQFFQRQALLWQITSSPEVTFTFVRDNVDQQVTLSPLPNRGISHHSPLFWYQLACASLIMLMGITTWAFAHSELGSRLYGLAAIALALAIFSSAIFTTRELALSSTAFLWLSRVHQFGIMMFAVMGAAMLWYYPTRLGRCRAELVLPAAGLALLAVHYAQLIDNMDWLVRLPFLLWFLLSAVFAYKQWQNTAHEPVNRARLKWLIYSWFAGVVSYIVLVISPQLLNEPPIVTPQYAWGFFVFSYVGIALGIVRYRLFDLDRWVIKAWLWFFCGVSMVALDVLLVFWLRIESSLSLLITVAISGWLYFPVRQWFLSHIMPKSSHYTTRLMPSIIERAFKHSTHTSLEHAWPGALTELFQPLNVTHHNTPLAHSALVNHGLALTIPALDQASCYTLSHAHRGNRLFTPEDQVTAEQLHTLFGYALRYRHAHTAGMHAERERLAADLHDDIGNNLLTIFYQSQEPAIATMARETLLALRMAMQDLQQGGAELMHIVHYWQQEFQERCQEAGITLRLSVDDSLKTDMISAPQRSQLSRIVRELINNGIRHAQATHISLRFSAQGNRLLLNYTDDGVGMSPDAFSKPSGMGLKNIRQRCHTLAGRLTHQHSSQGTQLRAELAILGTEQP